MVPAPISAYSLSCVLKGRPDSIFIEAGTLFGGCLNLNVVLNKKSQTHYFLITCSWLLKAQGTQHSFPDWGMS